jgi:lipooligosaccharide transport system ATP-binding protein
MPALVRARGLTKRFGSLTAVAGVDFDVEPGELVGFLGPNGAGKSSIMRMIGCVSPISGGELTVLAFLQLTDRADSKVEPLSGGMKRRLSIARALINEPDLVLLDEPTTGLDPQARHLLWERLYRLKRQGVTQILTTHYMDEAEQLCDRLLVVDHGVIVASGAPRELIARHITREVVEMRFNSGALSSYADKLADLCQRIEVLPDRILLYHDDGDGTVQAVYQRGLRPAGVLVRRAGLEDVFLRLVGRSLVET